MLELPVSNSPADAPKRAPRVATSIVATVAAGKRSGVKFTIENISVSGAKLEGPLTLGKGERITIVFTADGQSVTVQAEVVRVDTADLMTDQIAARFIDPSADVQKAIQGLVTKMMD